MKIFPIVHSLCSLLITQNLASETFLAAVQMSFLEAYCSVSRDLSLKSVLLAYRSPSSQ